MTIKKKNSLNPQRLNFYIKIANTHEERIEAAFKFLHSIIPLKINDLDNFDDITIAFLELATNRFAKLQDIISTKIFPIIVSLIGQDDELQTFIDKLNILEKFHYLPSADSWADMREIRNSLAHDYPETDAEMVKELNKIFDATRVLLTYWKDLRKKLEIIINKEMK